MALNDDVLLKVLNIVVSELKERYDLDSSDILKLADQAVSIPLCIFTKELSSLETIVKYLKENRNMRLKQIAVLLNRDPRTVWAAYNRSEKKRNVAFVIKPCKHIPASIFKKRRLSVLESIIFYLKDEEGLNLSEIGRLLSRDPRTVWTVYYRLQKKVRTKHEG